MKIIFLCRYFGETERGVEVYVKELSLRLSSKNHHIEIIKSSDDLKDKEADIIISTNGRLDAIKAKLWCIRHSSKLLIPGQSGIGWDDILNLWIFPDVFIGLTNFQCNWAKSVNPFVRIENISNGVNLEVFKPSIKPITIKLKKPIILNVGSKIPTKRGEISKGQDYLSLAAKQLNISLLCVGKGGDMQLSHSQMPSVYTACDLFVYPTSQRESFGISILEAMATNLPVVTTDDPIRREIVGEAGIFVDPQDIDSLSKAIKTALNTNWKDLPRTQSQRFSWDIVASKYDKLFSLLTKNA